MQWIFSLNIKSGVSNTIQDKTGRLHGLAMQFLAGQKGRAPQFDALPARILLKMPGMHSDRSFKQGEHHV
jgi:hypothetical protein